MDLSGLSNEQLLALRNRPQPGTDLSSLSNEQLLAMRQQPQQVSTAEDVQKTLLPSAIRAITNLSGVAGNIDTLARQAAGYIAPKIGHALGIETAPVPSQSLLPTSAGENAAVGEAMGAPLYEPKTGIGQVVGRTIEATPEILAGAGGGMSLPRAAIEIGLGPATGGVLAHKGAEKLGAGPVGTQIADFVGSMLGAYTAHKGVNAAVTAIEHLRGTVPTMGQLSGAVDAAYKPAFESGTTVDPAVVQDFRDNIAAIPGVEKDPAAQKMLRDMDKVLQAGQPIGLKDVQSWRSDFGSKAFKRGGTPVGDMVYSQWMDFTDPDTGALLKGLQGQNKDIALASWRAGDAAYKHELTAKIFENANERARGTWNWGKGVETQYRGLQKRAYPISTRHPPEERLFSPELKNALTEYAGGTPVEKASWMVSKFAPWRLLGSIGITGSALGGSPLGILGSLGAGGVDIGRWMERMYHAQQVNDLARLGQPLLQTPPPWLAAAPAAQQAFGGR